MTSKHGFSIDYGRNKERKDIFELNLKDKILKKKQNYKGNIYFFCKD